MSRPAASAAAEAARMMAPLARVAPVTLSRVVVWCSTISWGSRSMATDAMEGVSWHSVSSTLVILPSSTVMATVTVPCMPTEEPSKVPDAAAAGADDAGVLAAGDDDVPPPQAVRSMVSPRTPARIRFFIQNASLSYTLVLHLFEQAQHSQQVYQKGGTL